MSGLLEGLVIRKQLTNQKTSLSTCHHSSKHSGPVLGGSASGQEAKDGRARTRADAYREDKRALVSSSHTTRLKLSECDTFFFILFCKICSVYTSDTLKTHSDCQKMQICATKTGWNNIWLRRVSWSGHYSQVFVYIRVTTDGNLTSLTGKDRGQMNLSNLLSHGETFLCCTKGQATHVAVSPW